MWQGFIPTVTLKNSLEMQRVLASFGLINNCYNPGLVHWNLRLDKLDNKIFRNVFKSYEKTSIFARWKCWCGATTEWRGRSPLDMNHPQTSSLSGGAFGGCCEKFGVLQFTQLLYLYICIPSEYGHIPTKSPQVNVENSTAWWTFPNWQIPALSLKVRCNWTQVVIFQTLKTSAFARHFLTCIVPDIHPNMLECGDFETSFRHVRKLMNGIGLVTLAALAFHHTFLL